MNTLLIKACISFSFFTAVTISSCNKTNDDVSADVSDFVGYYDAAENCGSTANYEYTFYLGKGDGNEIFFRDLMGFNESVSGYVSGFDVIIPVQLIPGMTYTTISGEGTLNQNKDKLTLELVLDEGSSNQVCNTVGNKQ